MLDNLNSSKIELNGIQYHVRDSQQGIVRVMAIYFVKFYVLIPIAIA
jgi:hypothetical protein